MTSIIEIDENLYSRQIYVLGKEGMKNMVKSDVLLCGLGGLGVEIAKNIVLAGVKSVSLYDNKVVSMQDLSSQFFLKLENVGENRAVVSKDRLSELNNYVPINICEDEITEETITKYSIVVLTDSSLDEQKRINKICHKHDI